MLIISIIWIVREIMLRLKILERITEGGKQYLPKDYGGRVGRPARALPPFSLRLLNVMNSVDVMLDLRFG